MRHFMHNVTQTVRTAANPIDAWFLMNEPDYTEVQVASVDALVVPPEEIQSIKAEVWDEGFNAGHYYPGESKSCDCRENPYRSAS